MKRIIQLTFITLLTYGCNSYVQIFETGSINTKVENEFYIFENDSLKIIYSFWKQKGLMSFAIFNKLEKPLYIDWKKSSYIDNSVKLNYWVNEEKKNSFESYGSYYYDGPLLIPGYASSNTGGVSVSTTIKVERITFIPPKSNYYRSQFYILAINYFKLDVKTNYNEVKRNDKPKKKTKVYEKSFSKENSPILFRNFLTFSLFEDFNTEFYVDNEFYISAIKEMDRKHFEYYKQDESIKGGKFYLKDENGKPLKFSDFKKESSFYLYIPKGASIEDRK
ncbi:MAG: hypothetical protein GXO89_12460 [Chlorobi bacterium]|nr:hypothetical protein [Chlorobiota bacterium]